MAPGVDTASGAEEQAAKPETTATSARAPVGGWLSVARDGATDEEWRRALVAPRDLASTAVTGPLELFAPAEEWLRIVATIP